MPLAIIAAAVGAVGSVAGAAISSNAAGNAANKAAQAAKANNALQKQIYDQNSANAQPYIGAGNSATTELNGLLNLGGNTPEATASSSAALNKWLDSAGYGFVSGEGNRAITANQAVNGLLDSGGTLKSLDRYNTGLASTYLGQYEGTLGTIADRGANSANALATTGTNYANAVGSNNNNAAGIAGTSGLTAASNINQLLSNAIAGFSIAKGLSSYGNSGVAQTSANGFGSGGGFMG